MCLWTVETVNGAMRTELFLCYNGFNFSSWVFSQTWNVYFLDDCFKPSPTGRSWGIRTVVCHFNPHNLCMWLIYTIMYLSFFLNCLFVYTNFCLGSNWIVRSLNRNCSHYICLVPITMGHQTSCCLSCNVNSNKLIIVTDRFFFSSFSGICEVSLLNLDIGLQHFMWSACMACYQSPQKSVIQGMNPFYWGGFGVTLQLFATLALSVQAEIFCG